MTEYLDKCPVCNSDDFKKFIEIAPNEDFDGYSADMGEYYLCDCGCAFMTPRMTEDELLDYYTSGKYRENTSRDDPDGTLGEKQSEGRAKYIADMVRLVNLGSHLDIGCYKCHLLDAVSKERHIYSVGVDPDPNTKSDKHDIVKSLDEVQGQFDLITCIQTLEHILYPVPFMKKVYSLLRTGGICLVEVPNRRANMVAFIPTHHVIAYDEQGLRKVMEDFEIKNVLKHGFPFMSPLDLNLLVLATK